MIVATPRRKARYVLCALTFCTLRASLGQWFGKDGKVWAIACVFHRTEINRLSVVRYNAKPLLIDIANRQCRLNVEI